MGKTARASAVGLVVLALAGCTTTGENAATKGAAQSAQSTSSQTEALASAQVETDQKELANPEQVAAAPQKSAAVCPVTFADGPPPKPAKGSDFAKNAVGKNLGRNVGRNVIANIGARVGGGLGGAIAGGIARQAIRSEQDLDGNWNLTNGSPTCGCTIEISAGVSLNGTEAQQGRVKQNSCTTVAGQATRWALGGRSFTGYNTTLTLLAADRRTVLATFNRDGINYFSGQLSDGTPITMWRR